MDHDSFLKQLQALSLLPAHLIKVAQGVSTHLRDDQRAELLNVLQFWVDRFAQLQSEQKAYEIEFSQDLKELKAKYLSEQQSKEDAAQAKIEKELSA